MSETDTTVGEGRTGSGESRVSGLVSQVAALSESLESLESEDVSGLEDMSLVELRSQVKDLEDATESVRKNTLDAELKDRIEPGDSLFGLSHIESHRKYLDENPQSVIMRAVGQGIDYTEFIEVNASTLSSKYPDLAEIGKQDYTYLR